MHSIESRCVTGRENLLFVGASVHFQPGHFTGCDSEGVKILHYPLVYVYLSPQVLRTVSFWAESTKRRKTSDPAYLLKVKYTDAVKLMSAPFAFQPLMRGRLVYSYLSPQVLHTVSFWAKSTKLRRKKTSDPTYLLKSQSQAY